MILDGHATLKITFRRFMYYRKSGFFLTLISVKVYIYGLITQSSRVHGVKTRYRVFQDFMSYPECRYYNVQIVLHFLNTKYLFVQELIAYLCLYYIINVFYREALVKNSDCDFCKVNKLKIQIRKI